MTLAVAGCSARSCAAFGATPEGTRRARMERSPQWKDGRFENPQPLHTDPLRALRDVTFGASEYRTPSGPVPVEPVDAWRFDNAPRSGPGQSIEPEAPPALARWWPDVPWKTANQDPIVPTGVNTRSD